MVYSVFPRSSKTRGMIKFGTLFLYFVSLLNKDIRKKVLILGETMNALPSTNKNLSTFPSMVCLVDSLVS